MSIAVTVHISCDNCKDPRIFYLQPDAVKLLFTKMSMLDVTHLNWSFDGETLLCPNCRGVTAESSDSCLN